ncbi:MAG: hypothetical protein NZM07_10730 [Elioraea sp.]|nr:hypothetical protein [Elioraea sp.]
MRRQGSTPRAPVVNLAFRGAVLARGPVHRSKLPPRGLAERAEAIGRRHQGGDRPRGCRALPGRRYCACSPVEVARRSDTVSLAIRAAAPELVELPMRPALEANARFGLVTLAGRTEAPAMPIVRRMMQQLLRD